MSYPPRPPMTDLEYITKVCKRPLEEAAIHAHTTTTKLREELINRERVIRGLPSVKRAPNYFPQ